MNKPLQNAGLKVTPQRMLLLEQLQNNAKPVSIMDLIRIPQINNSMNQSTAYRSLEKLAEAGIIYKTYLNGVVHYEWQDQHHHHLVCQGCGKTEPIAICGLKNFTLPNHSQFAIITNHILEVLGVCQTCHNS